MKIEPIDSVLFGFCYGFYHNWIMRLINTWLDFWLVNLVISNQGKKSVGEQIKKSITWHVSYDAYPWSFIHVHCLFVRNICLTLCLAIFCRLFTIHCDAFISVPVCLLQTATCYWCDRSRDERSARAELTETRTSHAIRFGSALVCISAQAVNVFYNVIVCQWNETNRINVSSNSCARSSYWFWVYGWPLRSFRSCLCQFNGRFDKNWYQCTRKKRNQLCTNRSHNRFFTSFFTRLFHMNS